MTREVEHMPRLRGVSSASRDGARASLRGAVRAVSASLFTFLAGIIADLVRAIVDAGRAKSDAEALAVARTAMLDAIAAVESAQAREKFSGLVEP